VIIAMGWVLGALDVELAHPASMITAILLMSLPHLLLRLVDDFSQVPRWLMRGSAAMFAGAVAVLLLFDPLPGALALLLVAYFAGIQAYAAVKFVRQARAASGVTRRRMQAAAAGSAFLGLVLAFAGIAIVLPDEAGTITSGASQLSGLLSALAYLVAFAPPSVLKRAWQEPDLRAFLAEAASGCRGRRSRSGTKRAVASSRRPTLLTRKCAPPCRGIARRLPSPTTNSAPSP
jgi:hypothetical protein